MLALREAVNISSNDASLWTSYAAACFRAGRASEAESSLKQAIWLRRRSRDTARERVTSALLECLRHNPRTLRAAAA